jgi:tRNA U55 pseudouridine synthase TruB
VLAHDIGIAYGTGAALSGLRRTRIGDMDIKDSSKIEDILKIAGTRGSEQGPGWIKSLDELFRDAPSLYVKSVYLKKVKNGSRISAEMLEAGSAAPDEIRKNKKPFMDMTAVKTVSGRLIAIHRMLPEYESIYMSGPDKVFTKSIVIFQ